MRIFLSYASEDKDSAEQIYLALIPSGHQVFFDRATLPPGGDFNSRIRQAVRKSDLLIFLISPHSVAQSSYALTELSFARDKWPHPLDSVLPVMLRETEFGSIPNYLKAITVLEPQGNVAAEVADWLGKQEETLTKRFMRYITNNRILIGISIIAISIVSVIFMVDHTLLTTSRMKPALQEESAETKPGKDPEKEAPKGAEEPKHPVIAQNTHYNRGVSNMKSGRYDLAINDFTQVIIGNPNHSNAYYNRAVSYQKMGQTDKACDDFNKVLELSNDTNSRERADYNLGILKCSR
jgi:tetratricopeptide (TPR) repeat protein